MKQIPRTTMFNTFAVEGMTLRDYFAAKAMQALVTGAEDYNEHRISALAFELADAMIKAREA